MSGDWFLVSDYFAVETCLQVVDLLIDWTVMYCHRERCEPGDRWAGDGRARCSRSLWRRWKPQCQSGASRHCTDIVCRARDGQHVAGWFCRMLATWNKLLDSLQSSIAHCLSQARINWDIFSSKGSWRKMVGWWTQRQWQAKWVDYQLGRLCGELY